MVFFCTPILASPSTAGTSVCRAVGPAAAKGGAQTVSETRDLAGLPAGSTGR
jgi:hypothetical protein